MLIHNAQPHPGLLELIRSQGIQISDHSTPGDLNRLLQASWLRPGTRKELKGRLPQPHEWQLLRELGCIDPVEPGLPEVSGVLFLGASVRGSRRRLSFLYEHLGASGRATPLSIWVLGSSRPLDAMDRIFALATTSVPQGHPRRTDQPASIHEPRTEAQMLELYFQQAALPDTWRPQVVATADPSANTEATVRTWLQLNVPPSKLLVVSAQPHVRRQLLAVRHTAQGRGYTFDACGPGPLEDRPLSYFLDEVARTLFLELLMQQH